MNVRFPFIDLVSLHQEPAVAAAIRAAVEPLCGSAAFILGGAVTRFEEAMADRLGVACAVGVDSGTRALELILRALGIGPGDEVITSPFTFVATASAIASTGATPVFADIDPQTLNMDPAAVVRLAGPRTRAVLPVHLFGLPAPVAAIRAALPEIPVVEDACQAVGARVAGRSAGALGTAAALSFFPTKNLGGAGDGGMVLTDDRELAGRVRQLRHHGQDDTGVVHVIGYTARLDALQAAVLQAKLPFLEVWNNRRAANAARYREALQGLVRFQEAGLPGEHAWHQCTIRVADRDGLRAALAAAGIPTAVYYPRPLHLQPAFAAYGGGPGSLPHAEAAASEVLSLPVCPFLTADNREAVIREIVRFLTRGGA